MAPTRALLVLLVLGLSSALLLIGTGKNSLIQAQHIDCHLRNMDLCYAAVLTNTQKMPTNDLHHNCQQKRAVRHLLENDLQLLRNAFLIYGVEAIL